MEIVVDSLQFITSEPSGQQCPMHKTKSGLANAAHLPSWLCQSIAKQSVSNPHLSLASGSKLHGTPSHERLFRKLGLPAKRSKAPASCISPELPPFAYFSAALRPSAPPRARQIWRLSAQRRQEDLRSLGAGVCVA